MVENSRKRKIVFTGSGEKKLKWNGNSSLKPKTGESDCDDICPQVKQIWQQIHMDLIS